MTRRNREADVALQVGRALVVLLYIGGGVALLFACFGYLFSLVRHGPTVGFVLQLSEYALWVALGLLTAGLVLDILARGEGERRPR